MAPPLGDLLVKVGDGTSASENGDKPAYGPILRCALAKDGYPVLENVTTLYELFQRSVAVHSDKPCLGKRAIGDGGEIGDYVFETYKEVNQKVSAIGSALCHQGLCPHAKACNRHGFYCVPLYDSLGENAIEFIINHSEATLIFVAHDKLAALLKALPKVAQWVKHVVYWGPAKEETLEGIKALGVKVFEFYAFLEGGKADPVEAQPPKPNDLCTIMYTSGTTGDPKGVMLTHAALVAEIAGFEKFLNNIGETLSSDDVYLSFLPLAHSFDRVGEELLLNLGGSIGYWRGDIKGLVDDIGALRPTIFAGVPRVFDRIYSGVNAQVKSAGGIKSLLFHFFFNRKSKRLASGVPYHKASVFGDKLVFGKVKQRLGGRVRIIVSGGAPLAPHVEAFLQVVMCAPVVQGYGLTETCAGSFVAVPFRADQQATVGPPLPLLDFRLEAVPEMNYSPDADPPRGELAIRGPTVFAGYYKDAAKTDEVLDADGWFHTGDVAELTPSGALKIIDRKKNIFKLSQGEYIAVEKIEAVYKKNPLVEQIWVYGNSFESTLVAVVTPEKGVLMPWAASNGVEGDYAAVLANPKAKEFVLKELTATAKEARLKGFELVKDIWLDAEVWNTDNDLMTPTFKLKRPQLQKHFQEQINQMYANINKSAS